MDGEGLRDVVARLRTSASALAAIALALDAATGGEPLEPELAARIDGVMQALGVADEVRAAGPAERAVLGEIRHFWYLDHKLVTGTGRRIGWNHTEEDLLQESGQVTIPFARALKERIAPRLAGLAERLDGPGAAFLDVGCGVGALSVEFARLWPGVRVVGIDVWAPSLRLAHQNVARAGLGHRIELREQAGQDVPEVEAFDLAWIPSPFVPGDGPARIARRVLDALRPGGWMLYAMPRIPPEPLADALGRLRLATFGGALASEGEVCNALAGMGYVEVQVLPGPPSAPVAVIAARRPVA